MKSLIAILAAAFGLAGCIAVPVGGYSGGYSDPYGPGGYYYGAPATFSFGYSHHGHRGHGHRRYH